MKNDQIICIFIEEDLNRGNLNVLHETIHPSYQYQSPTEIMNGPDELAAFVVAFREAFPDLNIAVLEQIHAGESVVTRIRFTGTHLGQFLDLPPTGKSVIVEGCIISKFKEGLICEEWEILDNLTLLQQLGVSA